MKIVLFILFWAKIQFCFDLSHEDMKLISSVSNELNAKHLIFVAGNFKSIINCKYLSERMMSSAYVNVQALDDFFHEGKFPFAKTAIVLDVNSTAWLKPFMETVSRYFYISHILIF